MPPAFGPTQTLQLQRRNPEIPAADPADVFSGNCPSIRGLHIGPAILPDVGTHAKVVGSVFALCATVSGLELDLPKTVGIPVWDNEISV